MKAYVIQTGTQVEEFVNYLEQGWVMAFRRLRKGYKFDLVEIINITLVDEKDSAVCKGTDWWHKNKDKPAEFQMKSYISRGLIPEEQKPIVKGVRKVS